MRAGCVEYLSKPLRAEELGASLRRFFVYHQASALETQSQGKVFAFFGAKGGVGTTTLAVHLALHLTVTHGCKTLLIDHKHQLGHVALYLGLESTPYHFDELLRNAERLDAELLHGYLLRHSSGLDVLASPDELVAAGATRLRPKGGDIGWHVMADPEGNEFCAFDD